jgi:2-polyprenyl-3-methyl-5-hydroxy-6-metoxy-1,4-benzoquinol methylase
LPGPEYGPYHLEACAGCGHVVTRPEPREGELTALYGEAYYGRDHRRFVGPLELATSGFRRWRARDIARRRPPGTFLDIGCGSGLLAASVARHGWRVMGTELSDESARHAREALGVPVVTGEFQTLELPPASVDVVTMWQTFEHMREPAAVLKRVHEVLRPGGWLIISVPNRRSWQARFAGPRWFHLDVPRHLHHYGEATLRRMLEAASFRVDRVSHFNWEQNPFGWLQSMIDVATGTQNSLFDVIRGTASSAGARRWAAIAALVASPVLVPAAFGLALAESLARHGGTITVWASK